MADYANFQLKNYIPDKDIDKKLLPENSDSSNLHDVPVLDDFEKLLLVSKMARLWKGFKDVRNHSTVEVTHLLH